MIGIGDNDFDADPPGVHLNVPRRGSFGVSARRIIETGSGEKRLVTAAARRRAKSRLLGQKKIKKKEGKPASREGVFAHGINSG